MLQKKCEPIFQHTKLMTTQYLGVAHSNYDGYRMDVLAEMCLVLANQYRDYVGGCIFLFFGYMRRSSF